MSCGGSGADVHCGTAVCPVQYTRAYLPPPLV